MAILTVRDLVLQGKRVLLRADCNVPLDENGAITDDSRLRALLPTLRYLIEQGSSVVLMSHLGRPKGEKNEKFSLRPVTQSLEHLLGKKVRFVSECIGAKAIQAAQDLQPGELLLLENLRFHPGETAPEKDPDFAKQLALLGDCYVNDAFGTCHRAHSSTVQLPQLFPGKAAVGLLVEQELKFFAPLIKHPSRPFYAVVGGAKVSSKLGILKALSSKVDALFIGGAMANTFLLAQKKAMGNSLVEKELIAEVLEVITACEKNGVRLFLPVDLVCSRDLRDHNTTTVSVAEEGVPKDQMALDIGPQTVEYYSNALLDAKTVFWNGPMGVFEHPPFHQGTLGITKVLAGLKALSVVGGGDSVAAVHQTGLAEQFDHLSTGGGAGLELLENGSLPGIQILNKNNEIDCKKTEGVL